MRYQRLFIFLLLSLSACAYQVRVITPEPSAVVESATTSPIIEVFTLTPPPLPPTLSFLSIATLNPTEVFNATKSARGTDVVETPRSVGVYPIRFEPNGTFVDVVDSIPAEASKTYSISALKGQIMSVAAFAGIQDVNIIAIQVIGADHSALCSNSVGTASFGGCYFWRGVLPATQDYFVTIGPTNYDLSNFTLRVAINPPGVAHQFFNYLSKDQSITLRYSHEFAPLPFPSQWNDLIHNFDMQVSLQFIDTQSIAGTNLNTAYFMVGSARDVKIVEGCLRPFTQYEKVIGELNINGAKFIHSEDFIEQANNTYGRIFYRAVNKGICYQVTFWMQYRDLGVYAPELGIKEFDHAALMQKFQTILSTLVIK